MLKGTHRKSPNFLCGHFNILKLRKCSRLWLAFNLRHLCGPLTDAVGLSRDQLWTEGTTLHIVVWQKKRKCLLRTGNLKSKACCAVWSVNKHSIVNRTCWGIWHVFDTTIHWPCKCLHYSWSTNSTTTLDMYWQIVTLNGLHRHVLRQREGSWFNY